MRLLADEVDTIMIMDEGRAIIQVRMRNGFCFLIEEIERKDGEPQYIIQEAFEPEEERAETEEVT